MKQSVVEPVIKEGDADVWAPRLDMRAAELQFVGEVRLHGLCQLVRRRANNLPATYTHETARQGCAWALWRPRCHGHDHLHHRQVVDPACHVLRHQSRAHRYGLTATPTHPCHSDPASVARSRAHVRPPHQGVTALVAQGAAAWRGGVRCTDRARSEHSGSDSVHVQYLGHAPIARVVLEASARPLSVKSKCPALTFWAAAAR